MPFDSKRLNYVEIFNELTILVLIYPAIVFSIKESHMSPYMSYKIGWVIIIIALTNLIVNLSFVAHENTLYLRLYYRKFRARCKKRTNNHSVVRMKPS